MTIDQTEDSVDTAYPKAYWVLQNLDDSVPLYLDERGLRHPLGAYRTSLWTVGGRCSLLIQRIHAAREQIGEDLEPRQIPADVLDHADHLLDAVAEHFDVCKNILRSFFPRNEDPGLKKAQAVFESGSRDCRKHIGTLVNYLKHEQGILRPLNFFGPGGPVLGYYVEGAAAGGKIGPATKVHGAIPGGFSFNRDLRLNLCTVFAVGAVLANVLYQAKRLGPGAKRHEGECEWTRAVQDVSRLGRTFFPDEVHKAVPAVEVKPDGRVRLQFPSKLFRPSPPHPQSQMFALTQVDGVSQNYSLPYLST